MTKITIPKELEKILNDSKESIIEETKKVLEKNGIDEKDPVGFKKQMKEVEKMTIEEHALDLIASSLISRRAKKLEKELQKNFNGSLNNMRDDILKAAKRT